LEVVYILLNGSPIGGPVTVGANGSFATGPIALGPPGIVAGDLLKAALGSPAGPSGAAQVAVAAPGGATSSAETVLDSGASVVTVSGNPGSVVTVVDPATDLILGSGTVASNGQGAVQLSSPLTGGQTLDLVTGGILESSVTTSGTPGQAPVVSSGGVIVDGSVVQGTGVAGDTVQVVDASGHVLGSATVDAQGNFSLTVHGVTPGQSASVIQNGVKAAQPISSTQMGSENAVTTSNVFRPNQGGSLGLRIRALQDDHVTVRIFDLAGQLVVPLLEMDVKAGVLYAASWDGHNSDGSMVASGIYVISVRGKTFHTLKKVVVLK
jgi:hypothetical protein